MPTIKIIHGEVGDWNEGDVVPNAPQGLIDMAEKGTVNAATGKLIAEIVVDAQDDFEQLKARARELKVNGFGNMKYETLKSAIATSEEALKQSTPPTVPVNNTPAGDPTADQISGTQGGDPTADLISGAQGGDLDGKSDPNE